MRGYRILVGSFVLPDGSTLQQGARIELEDDVAVMHAHRIEAWHDPVLPGDEPAPEAEPEA